MMEVYPHPAIIELFELGSALQYKKGKIEERRRGQQEFQRHLRKLSCFSPAVEKTSDFLGFLAKDVASLRGRALKEYEDELDALVCAYVGYHYWAFRADRSRIFGDVDFGYIVVPMRSPATARSILD